MWEYVTLFVNSRSGKSNSDFLSALGQSAFLSDSMKLSGTTARELRAASSFHPAMKSFSGM